MQYSKEKAREKFLMENPDYTCKRKKYFSNYIYHPVEQLELEEIRKRRRAYCRAYFREWALKHPQQIKARKKVYTNIRNGKLKRLHCEVCGNIKSEAHHEDYSKPLEVIWLCKEHHIEADRKKTTNAS